ncbi:hypothetical protein [Niabella soli]|uniref:Response regulatory domain-containing protein n=1 Tax=Niabella soli DSM 19437 TaxID=929713 RepID=W0F937_9BACT|nr:hypothetical protein [Niabella soli]AHF17989.1 hypothetical protein NIASO_18290 [Niabella soli DSM 19437]
MKTEILGIVLSDTATARLKEQIDWNIVPAATTEEAIEKMQQFNFEVLVAPDGLLTGSDEAKLKKLLSLQEQDSMWITYTENEEAALTKEITGFLNEKATAPRSSFSVIDDGLKQPEIKIEIL